MPACLGNTATPHVLLLKKCHTRWYTDSRAWPGQRSEEVTLARTEAGKTDAIQVYERKRQRPSTASHALQNHLTSVTGHFHPIHSWKL